MFNGSCETLTLSVTKFSETPMFSFDPSTEECPASITTGLFSSVEV